MPVFVRASSRAKAYTRRSKSPVTLRSRKAIKKIDSAMSKLLAAGKGGQKRANQLARRRETVQRFYWKSVGNYPYS